MYISIICLTKSSIYATIINRTFQAFWLVNLEVINKVLVTFEQSEGKQNGFPFRFGFRRELILINEEAVLNITQKFNKIWLTVLNGESFIFSTTYKRQKSQNSMVCLHEFVEHNSRMHARSNLMLARDCRVLSFLCKWKMSVGSTNFHYTEHQNRLFCFFLINNYLIWRVPMMCITRRSIHLIFLFVHCQE